MNPTQDIIEDVKDYLIATGTFSKEEAATLTCNAPSGCPICVVGCGTIASFLPCHHKACSSCLDSLVDDYEGFEELFVCPQCHAKVVDITYEQK